jgi:hypothetical protein
MCKRKCFMNLLFFPSETLLIWKKKIGTMLSPWPEIGATRISHLANTAIVMQHVFVYLTVQLQHTNFLLIISNGFCFVPISFSQGCNSPYQHYTQPNKSLWTAKRITVLRKECMNIINFDAGLEKLQNNRLYQKWRKKGRSNVWSTHSFVTEESDCKRMLRSVDWKIIVVV